MPIDTKIKTIIAKFDNNTHIVQYNRKDTQFIAETNTIPPLLVRLFGSVTITSVLRTFTEDDIDYFEVALSDGSTAHVKVDLSPYVSPDNSQSHAPLESQFHMLTIDEDDECINYPIEGLVAHRVIDDKTEYLVKWIGDFPDSWEAEENVSESAIINYQATWRIKLHNNTYCKGPKCYFYVRTSQRKDVINADTSIDLQLDEIFKYMEAKKYNIINGYIDNGRSAKDMNNQSALLDLLDELENKHDCVIVMYDVSRFSRCLIASLQLIETLRSKNIHIEFVADHLSTAILAHRQLIEYRLSDAQALSQKLSQSTKEFIKRRKDAGLDIGRIPYGMKRIDGKNVPNIKEMEVIDNIKSMKVMRYSKIIKELKKQNITYRNKKWTKSIIRRLLKK